LDENYPGKEQRRGKRNVQRKGKVKKIIEKWKDGPQGSVGVLLCSIWEEKGGKPIRKKREGGKESASLLRFLFSKTFVN